MGTPQDDPEQERVWRKALEFGARCGWDVFDATKAVSFDSGLSSLRPAVNLIRRCPRFESFFRPFDITAAQSDGSSVARFRPIVLIVRVTHKNALCLPVTRAALLSEEVFRRFVDGR